MGQAPSGLPGTRGLVTPSQEEFEVEIRQVYEPAEFGAELTPELREQVTEQDARIRTQASAKLKS